ncbi:MAG TPA: D-Ala-D-Ala carboxypeptidase family metallohydrolase [Limnobacter sp.]|nr:D-Ala-D-Ala carboxypeptidase family metallohydrolase [Limnobacter sp.]
MLVQLATIAMPAPCAANFPECITPHFSLAELTVTKTGLPNRPDSPLILANLRELATTILQPVFETFGPRLTITSAYRSPVVNNAVRGSSTSQHCFGQAADFVVMGISTYELACWVRDHLDYGQLILEEYIPGTKATGWVHCSIPTSKFRNKNYTKFKGSKMLYEGILLTVPTQIGGGKR